MKNKNKHKGFTLIEITFSLLLLGVFISLFMPAIINIYRDIESLHTLDSSFNNAYNETIYESNRAKDVPTKYDDVDINELKNYTTLTLLDSTGNPVNYGGTNITYQPEHFFVYSKDYKSSSFNYNSSLWFNAYSLEN